MSPHKVVKKVVSTIGYESRSSSSIKKGSFKGHESRLFFFLVRIQIGTDRELSTNSI